MEVGYAQMPWLQKYPPEIPARLSYVEEPLYGLLERAESQHGSTTATIFFGGKLTYAEVGKQARQLAAGLQALGVQKGDRVAVMLANCPQAVIAYYGVLLAGAVLVQINPLFTPREITHILDDSGARILIALDLAYPKLTNLNVDHLIITAMTEYMPIPTKWIAPLKLKPPKVAYGGRVTRWQELLAHPPLRTPPPVDPKEEVALLQYTGATTGLPKGCMLTHFNLTANIQQSFAWLYKAPADRNTSILAALPFFHVYGMTTVLNFAVAKGATMILMPKFDPKETLRLIQKHRPTFFPGAPTMYVAINQVPNARSYRLDSVEACLSGAAPLPLEVQQTFEALSGGKLVEGYGLTEASPVTHANPLWSERRAGSVGLPFPDTEARVVNSETGEEVPVGEIGELIIRGPQVMKGYWNNPEATAETLRDGWLYTGDIARMDNDGYFYIIDRKKDLILVSGFNVYPREVEEVLYLHPGIQEASVVGVPDEYRGETVKAYVVPKEGHELKAEEVLAFCRQHLAPYKVPRLVEFRADLPKSLVGKVLRRVLRDEEQTQEEQRVVG